MAERYEGVDLVVVNDSERCIHSRFCVLAATDVFVPSADGPWIRPDATAAETVVSIVERCPSGALSYERRNGRAERPPTVNNVRVQENGPLAIHGDVHLAGREAPLMRTMLCRCGQSRNKPFCDGSHVGVGFGATGEPATRDSVALERRDGPVEVNPLPDGPLLVNGSLEICGQSGRTIDRVERVALCRCGESGNKPFCDGSHARVGFKAP